MCQSQVVFIYHTDRTNINLFGQSNIQLSIMSTTRFRYFSYHNPKFNDTVSSITYIIVYYKLKIFILNLCIYIRTIDLINYPLVSLFFQFSLGINIIC